MKIIESSACSCGFMHEGDTHFFSACSLYNKPRIHTSKCYSAHITFCTKIILLYGNDKLGLEEKKNIITEALRFIKENKRFD